MFQKAKMTTVVVRAGGKQIFSSQPNSCLALGSTEDVSVGHRKVDSVHCQTAVLLEGASAAVVQSAAWVRKVHLLLRMLHCLRLQSHVGVGRPG